MLTSKLKSIYKPAALTKQIESQSANTLEKIIEVSDIGSITIGDEPFLKLKIDVKRNGKKDYLAYLHFTDSLHFSDKGIPDDVLELLDDTQEAKVLALVQQYKDNLNNLSDIIKRQQQRQLQEQQEQKKQQSLQSKIKSAVIAKPVYIKKGIQIMRERLVMLQNLQSINICTLSSKGDVIAITKIELDGDIMTVISTDPDDNKIIKRHLLSIHDCNVRFANELFLRQIKTLRHIMLVLHNLKRTSFSIPLGLALPFLDPFVIAGAGAASFLIYRYNGQIIFKLAPNAIGIFNKFKNLKKKSRI